MRGTGMLEKRAAMAIPRAATPLVRRPRLEDRLADDVRTRLTIISAPPGAGKTTLMASWVATRPRRSIRWLTVDARHNEPGRLVAALRATLTDGAEPPEAAADDLTALDATLEDVARRRTKRVLALDDVQELTTPTALRVLSHLVERAPASLDIIIATRADPPIRTGRMRLDGRLSEIRNADLMFSLDEAGELFAGFGLELRHGDRLALWERTEGWAAGLVLVAIALERGADPHRFVQDEAATEAAVSDYLLSELLEQLDADTRQFLMTTAIVDRLNPDLACVLFGDDGAGHRLADLERRGLFVVGLDDGEWYRYHSLLAALLRARLRREDPALARLLHRAAAAWYLESGMTADAEEHARAAEDWELLGGLVVQRWLDGVRDGDAAVIDLQGVPRSHILETPSLAAVAAGTASVSGNATDAASYLAALDDLPAEAAPGAHDGADTATAVLVARVQYGCAFGTSEPSVQAARALSAPDVEMALRSFALLRRVELLLDRGDLRGAQALLEECTSSSFGAAATREATALLALVLALQGRATAAARLVASASEDAAASRPAVSRVAALAEEVARGQLGDGSRRRSPIDDASTEIALAGSHALSTVLRVVRAAGHGRTWLDAGTARHALGVRVLVALGVVEVLDPAGTIIGVGGPPAVVLFYVVPPGETILGGGARPGAGAPRAREALGAEAYRTALAALQALPDPAATDTHPRTRVELAALAAAAEIMLDDEVSANRHIEAAFDLAETHGIVAPLAEHSAMLGGMFAAYASNPGPHQDLALRLVDMTRRRQVPAYVEHLTDRESVVLHFLPTLMSNVEIAEAMSLSVNTVKTHLKAVYRKLGVDRRRQAVVRARQLRLL